MGFFLSLTSPHSIMQASVDKYPYLESMYSELADAYRRDNDSFKNIKNIKLYWKAVERNPRETWAWAGLAKAYMENNDATDAIRCYKRAIKIYNANVVKLAWEDLAKLTLELAEVHRTLGDWSALIEVWEKAVKTNPEISWFWLSLAKAQSKHGQHEKAIECYNHPIDVRPHISFLYRTLAKVYRANGYGEDNLVRIYKKAVRNNRHEMWPWQHLAIAYKENNQFIESIECCEHLINTYPGFPFGYKYLGEICETVKDWNAMIHVYNKARENFPNENWALEGLILGFRNLISQST